MSLSSAPLGPGEQPTLPRTPATPRSSSTTPASTEAAAPSATGSRRLLARLLDRYPELPPPLQGTGARVAFWSVVAIAAIWVVFYTVFLWATHDAYLTHAEDMATMTQALWTTTHGAFLHQTVCNIVGDTNCLGDVSRFAIHFEPIMIPLALLYALVPTAKLLQFVQVVVVATGALPAYWLASRRLRHPLAGVAFALLYLLYPPLQSAVTYDFHAVTLSAAFLMFALYFMLTRNDVGLVIACLLALATKEEIPVDVFMIGLSVALLQRRWKTGGGLVALSLVWLVGALLIMRAASPLGYSPTAGRYAALGSSPTRVALTLLTHPLMVVRTYVLSHDGVFYLRTLLSPLGYLPALSPWALLISGPALAINLLSNDPSMRAGIYQYNAEIAPVMVFAAIDAVAWLSAAAGWLARRAPDVASKAARGLSERLRSQITRVAAWPWARLVMAGLTLFAFAFGAYEQRLHGDLPVAEGFTWPAVDAHTALANRFVAMIPPDASVSGQSDLLPHLSNRRYVYLFPYQAYQADYVLLDVTGNIYPQTDRAVYADEVLDLLANPDDHVIAAQDGYLLLKRGPGPALSREDPLGLPESFYSFTRLGGAPQHVTDIRYGPIGDGATLRLVGYSVSPAPTLYLNNPYLTVTTYWQASAPISSGTPTSPIGQASANDYHIELALRSADGSELVTSDFATTEFRPMNSWGPDVTYAVTSGPILITSALGGQAQIGARVRAGPPDDTLAPAAPAQTSAPGATVTDQGALGVFTSETIAK